MWGDCEITLNTAIRQGVRIPDKLELGMSRWTLRKQPCSNVLFRQFSVFGSSVFQTVQCFTQFCVVGSIRVSDIIGVLGFRVQAKQLNDLEVICCLQWD